MARQHSIASTPAVRARMQRQAREHTEPELALRRELHARGLRYRLHQRVIPTLRRRLDIVFGPARVAVDVRGCFWHACQKHRTTPKANSAWWREKLARNVARDAETEEALRREGWLLVVVWEHDDMVRAAARVEAAVRRRR